MNNLLKKLLFIALFLSFQQYSAETHSKPSDGEFFFNNNVLPELMNANLVIQKAIFALISSFMMNLSKDWLLVTLLKTILLYIKLLISEALIHKYLIILVVKDVSLLRMSLVKLLDNGGKLSLVQI